MKLTSLKPRWLLRGDKRVGVIFVSPTRPIWFQSCMFEPTSREKQHELFNAALPEFGKHGWSKVQGCNPQCGWTSTPTPELATFESLSCTPSLDGSAGGLWHGFITNGEIVGGLS